MGNGEVALTALEDSLRATFRLTVLKPGSTAAPSVAFRYVFGETLGAWIPIGLSDPDGLQNGQFNELSIAIVPSRRQRPPLPAARPRHGPRGEPAPASGVGHESPGNRCDAASMEPARMAVQTSGDTVGRKAIAARAKATRPSTVSASTRWFG